MSLTEKLSSYPELQQLYNSQIHLPDYGAFAAQWESSLYSPIRFVLSNFLSSHALAGTHSLLYCAPGPHAPLLRYRGTGSLVAQFQRITLVDIDLNALRLAEQNLSVLQDRVNLDALAFDVTGPFGQRLCDLYRHTLEASTTVGEIAQRLADDSLLASSVFADVEQVLTELTGRLDILVAHRRYSCCVSEMVASFTGSVPWLAFRSSLYKRFSSTASLEKLDACLAAATKVWQRYNENFLSFHFTLLREMTTRDGFVVLVFDTSKVFTGGRSTLTELKRINSFGSQQIIRKLLADRGDKIMQHKMLSWIDHLEGFDVKLYGIPISDFQRHTHDVQMYVVGE